MKRQVLALLLIIIIGIGLGEHSFTNFAGDDYPGTLGVNPVEEQV